MIGGCKNTTCLRDCQRTSMRTLSLKVSKICSQKCTTQKPEAKVGEDDWLVRCIEMVAPRDSRKHILFLSPYAAVPPRYGGPIRVFNLCKQLSLKFDVHQFAQQIQRGNVTLSLKPAIKQVNPHYVEYSCRNPISLALYALTNGYWGVPCVWQSRVLSATAPKWLYRQLQEADIIHVEHPWQFQWVYQNAPKTSPLFWVHKM